MLVISIFSFPHNVFKRLLLCSCLKSGLCGWLVGWFFCWLVVSGFFSATLTAKVISWVVGGAHVFHSFHTPVPTQVSFQSHRLLFSYASAEVRGENTLERKFAKTVFQSHNHQVLSLTCSPLSQPGRSRIVW